MKAVTSLLLLASFLVAAQAKVYFEEKFNDGWDKRWVTSDWKKKDGQAGEFVHTAGKWFGDEEEDKGIQTNPDARFFAISAKLDETFDNKGKDLVIQYSVKHEQDLDCGGGYIKLLPGEFDLSSFEGETPYEIMFGPDVCGTSTKRIHAILTYKGKNLLIKKTIPCETDQLTHVYTLILKPDNTFQILVDNEEKAAGSLLDEWDFLPPKTIKDPTAKKPADWVDEEQMVDPEDVKPADWDDTPAEITDPEATKPDDWNEEDDGEWEAPKIPNPDYKGEWTPKRIKNPAFKGKWVAPTIDNPDYFDDTEVYLRKPMTTVGFELWQVKAGSLFDNILVTDDVEYAKDFAVKTWGKNKDAEKEQFDKIQKEKADADEEERKKNAGPEDEADEPEEAEDAEPEVEPEAADDDEDVKDEL